MQQNRSLTGKIDGSLSGVVVLFEKWNLVPKKKLLRQMRCSFQNGKSVSSNLFLPQKFRWPKVEGDVQTPSKEVELPG